MPNPKLRFKYNPPVITVESLKKSIAYKLMFALGRDPFIACNRDWLNATLFAVRDLMIERWISAKRAQVSQEGRQVYYLSMEFLIGRTLSNTLLSLGLYEMVETALKEMGLDISELINEESDPGLGNGGLGRLAACFLDSLATCSLPGLGYGIRYEYGMFTQRIVNGQQAESPDNWLEYGNAWELPLHGIYYTVRFGGRIQPEDNKVHWIETEEILACAYDQIIPGFDTNATNTLRLWGAKASKEINLGKFNQGDYFAAFQDKNYSENVSRVLYPDDSTYIGRELRLRQEYFLVSATIQDILRRHFMVYATYRNLCDKVAIHLNDTHPVLAIPELMRILIDDHHFSWEDAWSQVEKIFSYTNHTLMSEALETWPVDMVGKILPRHLQIIFEINAHFLKKLEGLYPNDTDLLTRVSLIDENDERKIRMAWLAVLASYKVNGVSKLHSDLMVNSIFLDFARIFPERFCNKTNGITPRRWLALANKPLSQLLDDHIGMRWRTDLSRLEELNHYKDSLTFIEALQSVKLVNKERLALYIEEKIGIKVNPKALFDVQIKRIHEYKRQLLNVLHVITRYNEILKNPEADWIPRVVIFSGKAASAYYAAKQIIHLINDVADVVNHDDRIDEKLKVVFIPNYSVSLAELIIPATDLSEQISLAGTEASGTGNMKFALNGALTIGTLDGANIEILDAVGKENMFIFGNTATEVKALREGNYEPHTYYDSDPELHEALTQIITGFFSPEEPKRYASIYDALVNHGDYYQLIADYRSYINTQKQVDLLYSMPDQWGRSCLANISHMGYFSSDRTIKEYADEIWQISPYEI